MATSMTESLNDILTHTNVPKLYEVQTNHKGVLTLLNLDSSAAADIARILIGNGVTEPTTGDLQKIQDCCKLSKVGVLKTCGESWGNVASPSVSAHKTGEGLPLLSAGVVEGDVSTANVTSAYTSFVQSNSGGVGSNLIPRGHLVWSNISEENVVSLFVVKGDFLVALHFLANVDPSFVPVTEEIPCEYEECLDDEEEDECEDECGLGSFHLLV